MRHGRITSAEDLVTSHRATVDGFLGQAIEKTAQARAYVEQGRRLRDRLEEIMDLPGLVAAKDIREQLTAAVGFSAKAASHFGDSELEAALRVVLPDFLPGSGADWRSEILFRFLLAKGDALGGAMRNLTGATALERFVHAVTDRLGKKGIQATVVPGLREGKQIRAVQWSKRAMLLNRKPAFIGKNVDVILLRTPRGTMRDTELLARRDLYLACGELKGGIDPAGADEHWKTARAALERIREVFHPKGIPIFFAAAAIERSMASDIFGQLESRKLASAANLTVRDQVDDLVDWFTSL